MTSAEQAYKQGWYMRDNKWFVTFEAARQELGLSSRELKLLLQSISYGHPNFKQVDTRTLTNNYSGKPFSVYNIEDLKRLLKGGARS